MELILIGFTVRFKSLGSWIEISPLQVSSVLALDSVKLIVYCT